VGRHDILELDPTIEILVDLDVFVRVGPANSRIIILVGEEA
jgi:hypothetical protein